MRSLFTSKNYAVIATLISSQTAFANAIYETLKIVILFSDENYDAMTDLQILPRVVFIFKATLT